MNLTKNCKKNLMFFMKNNYMYHGKQTKQTEKTIHQLYNDIYSAYNYLLELKSVKKENFYNFKIKKINNISQIPKPRNFNLNSFPLQVQEHINKNSFYEIQYTMSISGRNIVVCFITENENPESNIKIFNKYIDSIVIWLLILNEYSSKQCSRRLVLYLYFTSLNKELPSSNIHILDESHINTAFTTTCPVDSEIVIYRKEEWFKVFIHETFHNFALDFSDMNNDECHKIILDIFKVNSEVNLYESYTEFWAEIMNALFCSFFVLKDKTNFGEFLKLSEFFINFEISYSFFQLVKILKFMGLRYTDLYSESKESIILRNNLYKEKTNVLSYYVIKLILINNYQSMLLWCVNNNLSLLQFKKTRQNQINFCNFIKNKYKNKNILEKIYSTETFLKKQLTNKNKNIIFLLSNLRMTLCELG
jgi:hypothetical protein